MNLKTLLSEIEYEVLQGAVDREITAVVNDSRKIIKDSLFLCIKGANFDGHSAAEEAFEKGAAALIVQEEVPGIRGKDITVIRVSDTRYAMAFVSAAWFSNPAKKLITIGVTGTKGKTTTTYLIKSMLEHAGHKTALMGTIETVIGDRHIPSANTTPESYTLQEYFAEMVREGCDCVVMEVSSQALMMHRTEGFVFDYGIFTNISPDHIGPNEHKDFEEYLFWKAKLFRQCRFGFLNGDDPNTKEILKNHTARVKTFGLGKENDLYAEDIRLERNGAKLGVRFEVCGTESFEAFIAMPGAFSVYNALSAVSVALHMKVPVETILTALKNASVKGRIEPVHVSDNFTLLIDYAHNAVALESLLTSLREYHPERIVCLFGCGGNRSKLRRFEMGEVSGNMADFTIITSDNPRDEDPDAILEDIETGIKKTEGKYVKIADRKEAIRYAIRHGRPGDVVVLAGKGHEDYQEIRGVKHPMDERVLISEILSEDPSSPGADAGERGGF
ncbi:MAG: UDP-N-acetylmuramoyl-L-alanyl-D-glutamate--2,6-diaminopimelate ligase [Lachnospiraceae bacterium]|nr:UDP-N-acetylmuramoyl-L-alanyl-D-glutamate--2,6-diaminopimelate ligase [Lachnospiraceae bacterium]